MMIIFSILLTTLNTYKVLAAENDSSNEVILGDGFIQENTVTYIGDEIVEYSRITYETNYAVVTIKEGSKTSTFTVEANYSRLLANLLGVNANGGISTMGDRVEAYEYIYLTTFSDETILDPINGTISDICAILSAVLSKLGVKSTTILDIASALFGLVDGETRTKIVTTRRWYIVNQEATGEFMRWYRCEYSVITYVEGNNGWEFVSTETGSFEAFQPY